MKNAGTFIKSNFDIFQNSVLAGALLLLENLMETEFKCPGDNGWGIAYGLLFIILPAIMITSVSWIYNDISCHTCCKNKDNDTDMEETETGTCFECVKCCKPIINFVLNFKFVFFWLFILLTDGRYIACVFMSFGHVYVIQISQIVGLFLVFFLIITVVMCERHSKRNKMKYKHLLLQDTEIAVQAEAKKKQEEFINEFVSRVNWNDFNPLLLNTQKTLDEIIKNCKNSVAQELKEPQTPEPQTTEPSAADDPTEISGESTMMLMHDAKQSSESTYNTIKT